MQHKAKAGMHTEELSKILLRAWKTFPSPRHTSRIHRLVPYLRKIERNPVLVLSYLEYHDPSSYHKLMALCMSDMVAMEKGEFLDWLATNLLKQAGDILKFSKCLA